MYSGNFISNLNLPAYNPDEKPEEIKIDLLNNQEEDEELKK